MRKTYETLSVDVVKFEAEDIITASGTLTDKTPTETAPGGNVPGGGDSAGQGGGNGGWENPGQGEF